MQIQKILNNYSKPRSFTHTCISGGEEEKTNAVSLQRYLTSAKHPRVDDILSCEETFRGRFCRQKTGHQGGVNDNYDEADGKVFVNSFPEFENDKVFEIKLSLSFTSFFLLRFNLQVSETAQCMARSLCSFVLIDE